MITNLLNCCQPSHHLFPYPNLNHLCISSSPPQYQLSSVKQSGLINFNMVDFNVINFNMHILKWYYKPFIPFHMPLFHSLLLSSIC